MQYKIIADSCCDLNEEIKAKHEIEIVPLTIHIGSNTYLDNEELDTDELLADMLSSEHAPKTASPSPEAFMKKYRENDNTFVVTLSSALSSTYAHAVLAKNMILEEIEDKFVHVFDSLSASVGETLVSIKISELIKENLDISSIIHRTNEYIKNMKTLFILESLDNLVKAGRLSLLKGKLTSLLSIKPIMMGNERGEIEMLERVRGSKKAFSRLLDLIGEQGEKLEEKVLGIAHCNAPKKALQFKEEVEDRYNFRDIIIVETAGISTVYANDGGLIIAF
ncbi:MAG TPA: DegV family protein [Clostridiales bacterium]|nr:DegV family protein [Clostridiales bacterium]